MRIILETVDGPDAGRQILIPVPSELKVGRTEWADLCCAHDAQMSSMHFQLECDQHVCRVRDLGSDNGTFLNGTKITESIADDGDTILAGETSFRLSVEKRPSPILPNKRSTPNSIVSKSVALSDTKSYQGSSAVLEISTGPQAGRKTIMLAGQSVTVGRSERSEFAIDDSIMSEVHFTIQQTSSGWQIQNQNSEVGTQLNGVSIHLERLTNGDAINAGNTSFLFSMGDIVYPNEESSTPSAECFRAGLSDEDDEVRHAALLASVWTRQPWLLDHCREAASQPSPTQIDLHYMLAVLGQTSDSSTILTLGSCESLESRRYEILGAFGHPEVVPYLLAGMDSENARCAIAAGAAFTKMTGIDVESDNRVTLPAKDGAEPDEFEQEFLDDGWMPDLAKAKEEWRSQSSHFRTGTRWQRGLNCSGEISNDVLNQLDMRSRWEASLRGRYEGSWQGGLAKVEWIHLA